MLKRSRAASIRQHRPGVSPEQIFRGGRQPRMKLMRAVLIGFLALMVVLFVVALLKDSRWTAEGALIIEAPPEKVLPLVASARRWQEWMPWSDPGEEGFGASFEGPEAGAGSRMLWHSQSKRGELEITRAEPGAPVGYRLTMDDVPGEGEIMLEPYGVATRARWRYSGDLGGNLFARYFIPLMQKALLPTLQEGLGQLRAKVLAGG